VINSKSEGIRPFQKATHRGKYDIKKRLGKIGYYDVG
jgi:hypothetical protein